MAQHSTAIFSIDRLLSTAMPDRHRSTHQQPQASGVAGYGASGETTTAKPRRKPVKRRIRTTFTKSQLDYLELQFANQQYMVGEERIALARQLGLNEIQVKVWFQNRRIKWRRLQHQSTLQKLKQARFTDQDTASTVSAHVHDAHVKLQEETTASAKAKTQYVNGPKDRKKEVFEQAISPM